MTSSSDEFDSHVVPPDPRTIACEAFFAEHAEQILFVGFVHKLATQVDETARKASEFLLGTTRTDVEESERRRWEAAAKTGAGAVERMGEFRPLLQQQVLTRSVDNFLSYVSDLISHVFRAHPESFRGPDEVKWGEIAKHRGQQVDDLINTLIEKRVSALSQDGLHELVRYLKTNFGFDLFPIDTAFERARVLVEQRNLIVHRRGIVDRHFVERVPRSAARLGEYLEPSDPIGGAEFLAGAVLDIDGRAAEKFGLVRDVQGAVNVLGKRARGVSAAGKS